MEKCGATVLQIGSKSLYEQLIPFLNCSLNEAHSSRTAAEGTRQMKLGA